MADYQLAHLTLSTRMGLVLLMLNPSQPRGQITVLSREYRVSREFLYELREKAVGSITDALLSHVPGRKAENNVVAVYDGFLHGRLRSA